MSFTNTGFERTGRTDSCGAQPPHNSLQELHSSPLLVPYHSPWHQCGPSPLIRQLLGHPDLPQFVGDMAEALYFPERQG